MNIAMTNRHLDALAEVIADIPDVNERIRTAVRIGKVCAVYHPRFNWRKWDEACNVVFKPKREGVKSHA